MGGCMTKQQGQLNQPSNSNYSYQPQNRYDPQIPSSMNTNNQIQRQKQITKQMEAFEEVYQQEQNNSNHQFQYFFRADPLYEQKVSNLNSLKQKGSGTLQSKSGEILCDICMEPYHVLDKWPMKICINNHIICDGCIINFLKASENQPFTCPFCRLYVIPSQFKTDHKIFAPICNKVDLQRYNLNEQEGNLCLFAFQHRIYEIARAFKQRRKEDINKIFSIDCCDRQITDISLLGSLKNLVYLSLQNNKLKDLQSLITFPNLKIVNVSYNMIERIDWIVVLESLQVLACQYNKIKSIQIKQNNILLALNQLFMIGNQLQAKTVQQFKLGSFKQLEVLSIQSCDGSLEFFLLSFKNNPIISYTNNFPVLRTIILHNLWNQQPIANKNQSTTDNILQDIADVFAKADLSCSFYLKYHLDRLYQFGNLHRFIIDKRNPHKKDYVYKENQIIKKTNNFTDINSALPIVPRGKQTCKIRLNQKIINFTMGICHQSIRYASSVYHKQFLGLTLWGNIYNQGQTLPINGELRLQDNSQISTTIDFDSNRVTWHIDGRKIGEVHFVNSFLTAEPLYFILGVRDSHVKIDILK